jgi:hypothetical protein
MTKKHLRKINQRILTIDMAVNDFFFNLTRKKLLPESEYMDVFEF